MSLFNRLRGNRQATIYLDHTVPPGKDPATVLAEHHATELAAARVQISRLELQLSDARAATRWANKRTTEAAQAIQELRVTAAGGTVADAARARAALHVYENRLARYEGRPSPIDCPRACCAPAPTGASA